MSRFIQLHLLTAYGPSNLNRDDLGRPKTAVFGGKTRLRISSQCLKRHWRTSDVFREALAGHIGSRTKELGPRVYRALVEGGFSEKDAGKAAKAIAEPFGEVEEAGKLHKHKQLVHFVPEEIEAVDMLLSTLIAEKRQPTEDEVDNLRARHSAVDVAMFGRMLTSKRKANTVRNDEASTEAAVQVAHALTVHEVAVESDYFSAMDDADDARLDFFAAADALSKTRERADAGAAHIDENEFGSGVFYLYLCVNAAQLVDTVGDVDLAQTALRALVEAAATVAPSGKQNSYASRASASFVLAEAGDRQPRSLAAGFLKPMRGDDPMATAIEALTTHRRRMDHAYYGGSLSSEVLDVDAETGSLRSVQDFVSQHVPEPTDA